MRVVLVGSPRERERLRATLLTAGIDVIAEYDTLADAESDHTAGPVIATADGALPGGEGYQEAFEETLTPRELDVLELLAEGFTNKFIAGRLGISDQTVKFHIASILGKLGAANRTDAVRRAFRKGLVSL